jgi:pyruvate dehydrogenase E2 component (dihydrolipoamide acetyltransferase)
MAVPLRMPDLGTVEGEVTLVRWLKSEGDTITLGEPLFEVETDKGVSEVEAAMAGILEKRVAAEGARVASGETIAFVRRYGESAAPAGAAGAQGPAARTASPHTAPPAQEPATLAARRVAPVLAALAARWGVNLDSVSGTGPGGAVTRDDILRVRNAPGARGAASGGTAARVPGRPSRPLPPAQSIVAAKVSQSHREKPVYHVHARVDMSRVIAARGREAAAGGQSARFDAFFVSAAALSIAQSPVFRTFMAAEAVGEHGAVDIAVAVGIGDELYAPVVRGADRKSVADISREIGTLAEKAASHSLATRDADDSCFLVSNLGMFPVESFEAIIYPAHAAALAVGAVTRTPVAEGETVRVAPLAHLTLSVDHRLINGAAAARFLARVKQILENGESA